MKMVNYTLKKASSGIFVVVVEDSYERAMLFLRCQEFYESPFPDFRGKHFDIFQYMNHYRKENDSSFFTYPGDWGGFNVPGDIVEQCINHVLDDNSDNMSYLITSMGYCEEVVMDEIQAYLSTGLTPTMSQIPKIEEFTSVFESNLKVFL